MQSKYSLINYGPHDVEAIRKANNMDTEEKREQAFQIIEEWLLKQDHLIKKKYSRDYLERCLITCKGSIERTKHQIDFMCTMRTLMPQYFQITNLSKSDLLESSRKCHAGCCPSLTKEKCRVFIIRGKPNVEIASSNMLHLQQFMTIVSIIFMEVKTLGIELISEDRHVRSESVGEFLKSNDYIQGFYVVFDTLESNLADILANINIIEFLKFLPILTEGYGCSVKGVIFITASTLIEGFLKIVKPMLKEKIRNRIHVVTRRERLKEIIFPNEILPADYGGADKKLEEMHAELWDALHSKPVLELLKEMTAARTDESKRRRDKFNEQYMGISGSFRTMSID